MVSQIQPADFAAWRDSQPAAPVVLDVREGWEIQTAAVKPDGFTLLHIPLRELGTRAAQLLAEHGAGQPIACLCHHGMRSLQAANYLVHSGFEQVVNLQGGIAAWSQQVDASVAQY